MQSEDQGQGDGEERFSLSSDESEQGEALKVNKENVKLIFGLHQTCLNVGAFAASLHILDPVAARINNAWYILSMNVESVCGQLAPGSKKKDTLVRDEAKITRYQRQAKGYKTIGGSAGHGITSGDATSARLEGIFLSAAGNQHLQKTVDTALGDTNDMVKSLPQKIIDELKVALGNLQQNFNGASTLEKKLGVLSASAGKCMKDARARLRVHYTWFNAYYNLKVVRDECCLKVGKELQELELKVEKAVDMLKAFNTKAKKMEFTKFHANPNDGNDFLFLAYVERVKDFLELEKVKEWDPAAMDLIYRLKTKNDKRARVQKLS